MVRSIISFFKLCSNAHSIKFTISAILKWYNLETFNILAILYNHHTLPSSRTFSSKSKLSIHWTVIPQPPHPSSWKPLVFLPPCCYLVGIFLINGPTQHVASCVWRLTLSIIFSGFINIVTCINMSFLLMAE